MVSTRGWCRSVIRWVVWRYAPCCSIQNQTKERTNVPGRDLSKNKQRRRLRHHLTEEAARERPFSYDAVWEGGLEAYTSRYVRANLWRMTRTCDYDDAMQEARIVFLRCARQYKPQLDNAAWFMGVYKRSLAGRFADIATKDTRYRVVGELPSVANGDDDLTPYVQEP